MPVIPSQLQQSWQTTAGARSSLARLPHADRGPSWIRVLDAGRTSRVWTNELDTRATELASANSDGNPDVGITKAVDYLRGAAWHGNRALDAVSTAVADALTGHDDLRATAQQLLDPTQPVDMYSATASFESAVKHVDPSLLGRIGAAGHAGADELARSMSDIDSARTALHADAQRIHP